MPYTLLIERYLVTPTTAKALIDAGYIVNVEHSPGRIFDDEEFEVVGACLVKEGSWVEAPKDHIIVGLKELAYADCKLIVYSLSLSQTS
jgi:saccharopine dehydrogenase (NAD+, L-lysine forming)